MRSEFCLHFFFMHRLLPFSAFIYFHIPCFICHANISTKTKIKLRVFEKKYSTANGNNIATLQIYTVIHEHITTIICVT